MDRISSFLGLAKKAGKIEIGEEPVGKVCRARKAFLVVLANDAAENTVRRAAHFADAGHILQVVLPLSKNELGLAFGRTSCAMAALTDIGFAASLVKKLNLLDPVAYAPACEVLTLKSEKFIQRQKEKRIHEKKLLRNSIKPWSPKPDPKSK
ncbi:MAG: ribosomal L7Ae/L30e/S12e/Gadd45 family protein [Evtepia sp.]